MQHPGNTPPAPARHQRPAQPTGRNAASLKYDLLTALGSFACAGDKHLQRLTLRFITLIVARYNWQTDELSLGQREMAALWSVDERTVKRDVARLRAMGWLHIARPAARGRVAVHGLGIAAILAATRPAWAQVGPDFADRMAGPAPEVATAPPATNIISFPAGPPPETAGLWPRARAVLQAEHPAPFAAWMAGLLAAPSGPGVLRLTAPSRFVATFVATHHLAQIEAIARRLDPAVRRVLIGVA